MLRITELKLPLNHAEEALPAAIRNRLRITPRDLVRYTVARRAHDARDKMDIQLVYSIDVTVKNEAAVLARFRRDRHVNPTPDTGYRFVARAPADYRGPRPIVVGAGPCGLFAGLILAQMGFRPIIVERGKVVRERTKDTWGLWRRSELNPESNVQFGEGGAGTFSDGKLWSQIKDPRHLGRKVLTEFVKAGAPEEILTEAHPHIGTFRLVTMVESMRATVEALGGEYRFEHRVDDLEIETATDGTRTLRALVFQTGERLAVEGPVVLALGHSARDTAHMLHDRGVALEAKPFSMGVRIEHPQSWIDEARFGPCAGHPDLGAAAYTLSHHCKNERTVYSFCMCPGGTVVAATSEPGRVATNGMSQYSRNERNANSGIVVGIDPARDYPGGPLAGIALQRHWEEKAFAAGGGGYVAPAQRLGDFLAGRPSTKLGSVIPSYRPGVKMTDLSECLPDFVIAAMREALVAFGRQIPGYDHPDAVLTGIETRTSSPIRVTRGADFQSINTTGLYPAGEGAGYAGGILSAAVDGIKVAEAVGRALAGIAVPQAEDLAA
ncbi:putative FAD-dependent dehydrogenase [Sphingomonas sp. SORGH_AS802]|uniref:NAD(P)/FAD-dependent oxidoreductase n=1 Tax=unclassified Sphingomonas TaxID=196159 RepID=UPI00286091F3|nr:MULTISPECIES: NAD(P)/FAD-dependent oxidoreductase [unclassified Sphingomonas]MDR6128622.1 putative FAD-dependent dehydrogenase [Sphingomonas sp. SORGH_AS_0438]MDR6135182.1 putative FAD-dependent dehydrogenase [Sphingomonas sp. SORGH_AS_0802]